MTGSAPRPSWSSRACVEMTLCGCWSRMAWPSPSVCMRVPCVVRAGRFCWPWGAGEALLRDLGTSTRLSVGSCGCQGEVALGPISAPLLSGSPGCGPKTSFLPSLGGLSHCWCRHCLSPVHRISSPLPGPSTSARSGGVDVGPANSCLLVFPTHSL